MTIDPKDLRTLLIRVTLVTLAVRLLPLISNDLGPSEAATAMGLGSGGGPSAEWSAQVLRGWVAATGGIGLMARLPALLCDLMLPILAVVYARAAGWGAICGLFAGLVLAIAPLGITAGHRLDGGAAYALLALGALALLRSGLQRTDIRRVLFSVVLLATGGFLATPLLVLAPAGLYLAVRTIGAGGYRNLAIAGWAVAPLLALAMRYAMFGWLVPEADAAARWLVTPGLAGVLSGWQAVGAPAAALQGLLAALPGGPSAELATQLGMIPAPLWAQVAAGLLVLLALAGFVRGQVHPDPPPVAKSLPTLRSPLAVVAKTEDTSADDQDGAGAHDGWRTLGVGLPSVPRRLGDRDLVPLLLGILGAVVYVAQAGARGVPDGLQPALQVARVCGALLLGVGLTALTMPPRAATESQGIVRRRYFTLGLGACAMLVFALGAAHLMAQASSPDRQAPRKVARYARDTLSENSALLALGPRGLAVTFLLDPLGADKRIRHASLDPAAAASTLSTLLMGPSPTVLLTGDRQVLLDPGSEQAVDAKLTSVRETLDDTLQLSGLQPQADGARVLGGTAVVVYGRDTGPGDPRSIRPQLAPGLAP